MHGLSLIMGGKWGLVFLFALVALASLRSAPSLSRLEIGLESVSSGDVRLAQANLQSQFLSSNLDVGLSASLGRTEIEYQPVDFDFLGREVDIEEHNKAIQINARSQIGEKLWYVGGVGFYDGFTNYRSIWLDEYYRQQFGNLAGVPGAELYVEADPHGINATSGIRWEYLPSSAYAQLTVSQLQDDVSPGYEIDFEGLRRGELVLATSAIALSTENVINMRIRSLVELRGSQTSARDWRYGLGVTLFAALGERWITRWQAGATTEDPQFEAYSGSVAVEYQVSESVSAYLDLSYYDDTGEIENAFLFTSAAPGLISRKAGIGLRWSGETWSGRLYVAPSSSRYEPTQLNTDFFQNLYANRDWTVAQIAFGRSF